MDRAFYSDLEIQGEGTGIARVLTGTVTSAEACAGPWSPQLQHGGPPSALLVLLAERLASEVAGRADLVAVRLAAEFLGPVPVAPLGVTTRISRLSRSAVLVEAGLGTPDRVCLQARIWLLAPGETVPPAERAGAGLAGSGEFADSGGLGDSGGLADSGDLGLAGNGDLGLADSGDLGLADSGRPGSGNGLGLGELSDSAELSDSGGLVDSAGLGVGGKPSNARSDWFGGADPAELPEFGFDTFGYARHLDWRALTGSAAERGPAAVWIRPLVPVVEGHQLSPLQRAALLADSASGISAELDWAEWSFANVDLDLHLFRPVHGDWLLVDAVTELGAGIGMTRAALADRHGSVGAGLQTLLVRRSGT